MFTELDGVHRVRKRLADGTIRYYYYAWRGGPRMASDPKDLRAFVTEWLRLTRLRPAPADEEPRVLADLIRRYVQSADYTGLSAASQESYGAALDRIEAKFHSLPVEAIEEKGFRGVVREWRDKTFATKRRQGDMTIAVFHKLLSFALDEELIGRNPLDRLSRLTSGTRRDIIWTDEQMAAFAKVAPQHLVNAMILASWTGQRQTDLLKLTWSAYDGTYLRLQQGKAGRGKQGRRVKILCSAELQRTLAAIRAAQQALAEHPDEDRRRPAPVTILTTEDGRPWRTGFKASWAAARKRAGISGVTFHDFRGTFITLAHRAGASIRDIAEASGHDEKECERVIRQHYLASGAETVIRRLEARAAENDS